jgi:NTE family protein
MSPLSLVSRSLDVVVDANVRQQLDSLGADDIAIEVPMGDIGSADFERTPDAIPLGLTAARSMRSLLSRYSVSPAEYVEWRRSVAIKQKVPGALVKVEVKGLNRVSEDYVRTALDAKPGDTLSYHDLDKRAAAVYALDDFENVSYRLRGSLSEPILELQATEKSWGPHFLRFDLGLAASTEGETPFVLRADYLRHWVNSAGGELHGAVQLGRTSLFEWSLYQPLDAHRHRWFVEPGFTLRRGLQDLYFNGDAVARYDVSYATGALDIGTVVGRSLEMRVGLRSGVARFAPDIAPPGFASTGTQDRNGWIAKLEYDTRNTELLPTRGWLVRINYFGSEDTVGSATSYSRLEALAQTAITVSNDVLIVAVSGGSSLGSNLPIYDQFLLGGPQSFPGFRIGELLGDEYWTTSASYLRKIADISRLFGQSLYLGLQLQAGEMRGSHIFATSDEYQSTLYSGSFFLTGRTPIGPATLSFGLTNQHGWMLSLGVGRPIEEGNIVDFAR